MHIVVDVCYVYVHIHRHVHVRMVDVHVHVFVLVLSFVSNDVNSVSSSGDIDGLYCVSRCGR